MSHGLEKRLSKLEGERKDQLGMFSDEELQVAINYLNEPNPKDQSIAELVISQLLYKGADSLVDY